MVLNSGTKRKSQPLHHLWADIEVSASSGNKIKDVQDQKILRCEGSFAIWHIGHFPLGNYFQSKKSRPLKHLLSGDLLLNSCLVSFALNRKYILAYFCDQFAKLPSHLKILKSWASLILFPLPALTSIFAHKWYRDWDIFNLW